MATVLVVDDDDTLREAFSLVLEEEGYHVLQAANGEQALAQLNSDSPPMVVLLDRMMPILSGDHLLLVLAASPKLGQRHAIALITAAGVPKMEAVRTALEKLNVVLFPKPFEITALISLVEQLVERLPETTDDHCQG